MLLNALRPRVDDDPELVADVLVALVNGALETIEDPERRREVVTSAVHRLTGQPAEGPASYPCRAGK